MNRYLSWMLLLCSSCSPALAANCAQPSWLGTRPSGAHTAPVQLAQAKLPVLTVFVQPNCPPCSRWKQDFHPDTQAGRQLRRWYRITLVDVTENPDAVETHALEKIPTFLAGKRRFEGYGKNQDRQQDLLTYFDPQLKPIPQRQPEPPPAPPAEPSPFELEQWQKAMQEWEKLRAGLEQTAQQTQQIAIHLQEQQPAGDLTNQIIRGNASLVQKIDDAMSALRQMKPEAPQIVKEIVREVGPKSLAEFLGVTPWVLSLLGLTVSTVGTAGLMYCAMRALGLIGRWRRRHPAYPPAAHRRREHSGHQSQPAESSDRSQATAGTFNEAAADYIIQPVAQTVVQSAEPELVPVEVPNLELQHLHQAMAQVAKTHPGGSGAAVVQVIKDAAAMLRAQAKSF